MTPGSTVQSVPSSYRRQRWALFALFLVSFALRVCTPVSRPLQWHDRSIRFVDAVARADFGQTLYSEHPGVTVMWLSGLSQWGYYGLRSVLGQQPIHPLETDGRAYTGQVAAGLLPLALVISLGLVWGWRLLVRLAGRRLAWAATLLWTIDPFFLANAKVLHLDALLSTLMLLSTLYMLLYLRHRDHQSLLWSATLGGLALLTKTAALFLIPFFGLCLLAAQIARSPNDVNDSLARRLFDELIRPFVVWLLVICAVWVILWPAMWVRPGDVLDLLYQRGFVRHAVGGRPLPLLYRGEFVFGDPGVRFYLDGVLFRTTFLSLPFALVGLLGSVLKLVRGSLSSLSGASDQTQSKPRQERRLTLRGMFLLAAYVVFFFVQMSLGAGKDVRYLLPVFLVLDLLAAVGLLSWIEGISRLPILKRFGSAGIALVLLLIQAALVIPRFPYFGLHYNTLLGGVQAARQVFPVADFGEGLDLAGRYLDSLPDAPSLRVSTQYLANEMLAQYIRADISDVAQVRDEADFLVFGAQYNARSTNFPRWGEMWHVYKFHQPERVFSFDGLPYAWVYRARDNGSLPAPDTIPHPLAVHLGDAIHLRGYRLEPLSAAPGDALLLTLYWEATRPIADDYTVFTHLIGPSGELVTQQDNPPVRGTRPTSSWAGGERVTDTYELVLPADAPLGEYALSVGMYQSGSGERLIATTAEGASLPQNQVTLTTVSVRAVVPWWRWALTVSWLLVIGLGCVTQKKKGGTLNRSALSSARQ